LIYLLLNTPEEAGNEFVDWQQATLTLDLSNSCMGDPLTALNKGHGIIAMRKVTRRIKGVFRDP